MKKIVLLIMSFAIINFAFADVPSNVTVQGESAQVILDKIIAAYKTLQTYKTEGTASMMMNASGQKMLKKTDFSIILKKPNMYLVSWVEKKSPASNANMTSAIWNNGSQSYLYQSDTQLYSKMPSDAMALNMATGLSFEAVSIIPTLFLYASSEQSPLKSWTNLSRETDKPVNGVDCYVISGSSIISQKETIWVSKQNYYILKYRRSLTPPGGGFKLPEVSDEKLNERLKSMGMVMTEDQKKIMRAKMREMMEKMKGIKLSGTATQNFLTISSPTLGKQDFWFNAPKGIVLKETFPSPGAMMLDIQKKAGNDAISRFNQAKTEEEKFYTLGGAAKAFFNQGNKVEALKLANELNHLIPKYWHNNNYGNAIQDVSIVYGRVAISDGNIEEAKKYLLEAANSSGSPVMNSFGPNMSLAQDLLEKGQKDTVLKYFELCSKFWKMDFGKLKEWTEEVKSGKTPDFGAALIY